MSDGKVEIYKIANHLKMKLGRDVKDKRPGYIDPEAVEAAEKLIEVLCKECPQTIGGYLQELSILWDTMREMAHSSERDDISKKIYTVAHQVKDIAEMCGFDLIAYFAESLRDYIGETKLNVDAQRVIIQAHLDAMQATHSQNVKDDAGPLAEELKKAVKIAIEKYS